MIQIQINYYFYKINYNNIIYIFKYKKSYLIKIYDKI